MRGVTGIELGADSCALARVHGSGGAVVVSAVDGLRDDGSGQGQPLGASLREIRRKKRLPRRARVVAWGVPDSPSMADISTSAVLAPLVEAGFRIDGVVTPPEALAMLARQRPRGAGRDSAAWLSLNRHAAAIAIVNNGELLYSRTFDWNYRPGGTLRQELLQRYSLVAHLAPELRHGLDVVRATHGVAIDAVVTCGDLPDLRSLTMPLIEELDMEVETLDSLDGIEVAPPARAAEIAERAPALRLLCAAAVGTPGDAVREAGRFWIAAAAVLLLALLAWGAVRFSADSRQSSPMASVEPADPPAVGPPAAAAAGGEAEPAPASPVSPPVAAAPTTERIAPGDDSARPAATMGRRGDAPPPGPAASRPLPRAPVAAESAAPDAPRRRPMAPLRQSRRVEDAPGAPRPLDDPLPVVNSILVAPDRRLAVLDGAILREGQAVGRRTLIRIEPDGVLLREPSGHEVRVLIRRKIGAGAGDESRMELSSYRL